MDLADVRPEGVVRGTMRPSGASVKIPFWIDCPCHRLWAVDVSALSDARFHESVKLGEALGARSIEPLEGGRWRLRWTRASGWTRSNGYGN